MKTFFITILLISQNLLMAEVYTLGNSSGTADPSQLSTVLKQSKLWDEPAIVNGIKTKLGVSLLTTELEILLKELKIYYPKARYISNAGSTVVEVESENWIYKIFLISITGKYSVIQFSMRLPKDKKKDLENNWPKEIPLPGGFTPLTSISFSERKSFFGHFEVPNESPNYLYQMDSLLVGEGWKPVTQEAHSRNAKGEIYMKNNKILILNFSGNKGSIYTKTLPKP